MPLQNSPNHFLASLSPHESELLGPHLKSLQLRQGAVIYRPEETIEQVYFPHTGVVSLVVGLTTGQFVEAGMLGRNSAVGAAAPLDGAIALIQAIIQVESAGMAAETAVVKQLAKESETLRVALEDRGGPMARYYFHIKDGADLVKDQEGTELASPDAARAQALRSAQELWADAIKSGKPLGADAVVIADEQGGTLTFVPMNEALPKRPG
jgi:CRP-like cAMP-binding protein